MKDFAIYPCPQWVEYGSDVYEIKHFPVTIWQDMRCSEVSNGILFFLSRLGTQIQPETNSQDADIIIGIYDTPEIKQRLQRHSQFIKDELPKEGYYLIVDEKGAIIAGSDANGCLYGVGALIQLIQRTEDSYQIPYIQVRDWPYKALRGVHLYLPGRANFPFFKRLVGWLASLHYNTIFLEVSGGMRYDRHPEINQAWAKFIKEAMTFPGGPEQLQMSQAWPKDSLHVELAGGSYLEKDEVADLVSYIRGFGMDVVPELQSWSHSYYLVLAHPEIAERPYDPWPDTYCPSDPRSYELYFDVLDEAIEVFHPKMVHIGHDELYTYGICERCRDKSGAELYAGDLQKISGYLSSKGIRTVFWADKIMNIIVGGENQGGRSRRQVDTAHKMDHTMIETYQAVNFIPKDVLVMDWYWSIDPLSEQYFQKHGFQTIFGNMSNFIPWSFDRWQERSRNQAVQGGSISTWAEIAEYPYGRDKCFHNLLHSANMLWWPGYHDRERETTMRTMTSLQPVAREMTSGIDVPSLHPHTAKPIDLSTAVNAKPLAGIEGKLLENVTVPFILGERAVLCNNETPQSVEIKITSTAKSVIFLHYDLCQRRAAFTWEFVDPLQPDPETLIGYYLVKYSDGSSEKAPIRHGDTICRRDGLLGEGLDQCPFWAPPAWEGRGHDGVRITLWAYEWINPWPEKQMESITMNYTGKQDNEQIVLAAATLIA